MTNTTTPVTTAGAALDMRALSYLSILLLDDHNRDDQTALQYLTTLTTSQIRAIFLHNNNIFQSRLYGLFQRGMKAEPDENHHLKIFGSVDQIICLIEKLRETTDDIPECIGFFTRYLWHSIQHAYLEKNEYSAPFTVPDECLQKVNALTQSVIKIGPQRLIKLADSLMQNAPYSSYCIIRIVSRFAKTEAKADLKSFILNRYQFLPRMRFEEAESFNDAIQCLVEAGIAVADQDLPWNKFIEAMSQAYLRMKDSALEEASLERLLVLAEKVASIHKDRTIRGGQAAAKCLLGNRYGRIEFDNAGNPHVVGAWLVPQELKRERQRRGHLEISQALIRPIYRLIRIDPFYFCPALRDQIKEEERALEVYFTGEKIRRGSQEEVDFAYYILSHIKRAQSITENNNPGGHAERQWAEMIFYYGKKLIKTIFCNLEHAAFIFHRDIEFKPPFAAFIKKTLEESPIGLFEDHLRKMALGTYTISEQKDEYQSLPFEHTISCLGPELLKRYLSILLGLVKEKVGTDTVEKAYVHIRQLRLFSKVFGFAQIDDPLSTEIMEVIKQKTLGLHIRGGDVKIIALHVKFWEAAISSGLKNTELRIFAINFLIDVAYYAPCDNLMLRCHCSFSLHILPELLKRIVALGEAYPRNIKAKRDDVDIRANTYAEGPEAFFRDAATRELQNCKESNLAGSLSAIDIPEIIRNCSDSLQSVALQVAVFRLRFEGADTLCSLAYQFIFSENNDDANTAFEYLNLLYAQSSNEARADILIKLIDSGVTREPTKICGLLILSLSQQGLPFGIKEDFWREIILNIHVTLALDWNFGIITSLNESRLGLLCALCQWDIKQLLSKIIDQGEKGQGLLLALCEYLTSNVCRADKALTQDQILSILSTP